MRREGRLYDLPSNVSVKQLQPFPQYPPEFVGDLDTSVKVFCFSHYINVASLDWHFLERKVHIDFNFINHIGFNF